MRKKYAKLFIGTSDVLKQTICKIKLRRAPTLHDNIEYAIVTRMSKKSLFLVLQRKQQMTTKITMYLVREKLHAFSVIPTRYEDKSMEDSWHIQKGNEMWIQQDSIKLV